MDKLTKAARDVAAKAITGPSMYARYIPGRNAFATGNMTAEEIRKMFPRQRPDQG